MSLAARQLEQNGITTVIIGSARDIVEYVGVPRFVFTDFPLGNPCGRPYDSESQQTIMSAALDLAQTAREPGVTVQTPLVWDDRAQWKQNFMHVGADNIDEPYLVRAFGRCSGAACSPNDVSSRDGAPSAAIDCPVNVTLGKTEPAPLSVAAGDKGKFLVLFVSLLSLLFPILRATNC